MRNQEVEDDCELCERFATTLSEHHLIPRKMHSKRRIKKLFSREEMRTRTAIIISHRVSTAREADRIFVLDDGEIVATGTHTELVAAGGLYAEMVHKQMIMMDLERGA